ncbi:MAG: GNAT family N-acetyltransferase [Coriobacteriales bacterium]|nr:GNAT family N-acetyltransferase [Coriobacteriales bacterium]
MTGNGELRYVRFSERHCFERSRLATSCFASLRPLCGEYPAFASWYGGLFNDRATLDPDREMLLCMRGSQVAGVAILKYSEQKICTLRVSEQYRGNHIGTWLLAESCELLGTDRPLITVRSTRLNEYAGLFKRFGFKMEDRRYAYYSMLHSECAFNGALDRRVPVIETIEFLRVAQALDDVADAWRMYTAFPGNLERVGRGGIIVPSYAMR